MEQLERNRELRVRINLIVTAAVVQVPASIAILMVVQDGPMWMWLPLVLFGAQLASTMALYKHRPDQQIGTTMVAALVGQLVAAGAICTLQITRTGSFVPYAALFLMIGCCQALLGTQLLRYLAQQPYSFKNTVLHGQAAGMILAVSSVLAIFTAF